MWEIKKKREIKENGSDSRCFNGRKSIGRELKLVYLPRATSRCKKKKQKKVRFSPTLVPPNLRVVNVPCGSALTMRLSFRTLGLFFGTVV